MCYGRFTSTVWPMMPPRMPPAAAPISPPLTRSRLVAQPVYRAPAPVYRAPARRTASRARSSGGSSGTYYPSAPREPVRNTKRDAVIGAARDVCVFSGRASAEYADLCAIRSCTSKAFFPWYGIEQTYPFPAHLDGLVESAKGDVNQKLLAERIAALHSQANL